MTKPTIVYRGALTGRFYATKSYRPNKYGSFTIGVKDDVTDTVREALQGMSLAEIKRFRAEKPLA